MIFNGIYLDFSYFNGEFEFKLSTKILASNFGKIFQPKFFNYFRHLNGTHCSICKKITTWRCSNRLKLNYNLIFQLDNFVNFKLQVQHHLFWWLHVAMPLMQFSAILKNEFNFILNCAIERFYQKTAGISWRVEKIPNCPF